MWLLKRCYINIILHIKKLKENFKKSNFFINQINTISIFRFSNKVFHIKRSLDKKASIFWKSNRRFIKIICTKNE